MKKKNKISESGNKIFCSSIRYGKERPRKEQTGD